MSYILPYKDGHRAFFILPGGQRKTKVFRLKSEANRWLCEQEQKDPLGSMTFEQLFNEWLPIALSKLSNASHKRNVEQSLRDYAMATLAKIPIADISRADLVAVIKSISDMGKIETASRVGQRLCSMMDYAVDCGHIDSHKAAGLSRVLPSKKVQPQKSIAPLELPKLLKDIAEYPEPITRIGLMLMAHTFVRTKELIGWRRDEVIDGNVWVIPAERMKMKMPHVVPLSKQVLCLLKELDKYTRGCEHYLASTVKRSTHISNNTLLFALYRLGYRGKMTGHGFRSVASTILNQSMQFTPDVIERQLSHEETNKVRAAYNRADFLEERIKMLQWWSDYWTVCAQTIPTP